MSHAGPRLSRGLGDFAFIPAASPTQLGGPGEEDVVLAWQRDGILDIGRQRVTILDPDTLAKLGA